MLWIRYDGYLLEKVTINEHGGSYSQLGLSSKADRIIQKKEKFELLTRSKTRKTKGTLDKALKTSSSGSSSKESASSKKKKEFEA